LNWEKKLNQWKEALNPFLDKPVHVDIRGPVEDETLDDFEDEIVYEIPDQLRDFLLNESAYIKFWWHLKPNIIPLDVPDRPYSGSVEFNLESMQNLNADRTGYLSGEEPKIIKKQWEQAFVFLGVANGDAIALDVFQNPDEPPVIYLNHEEREKQVRLADSFNEFIEAWFSLGCVGPEGWNMRHFVTDKEQPLKGHVYGTPTSNLDVSCKNAINFRSFFGL